MMLPPTGFCQSKFRLTVMKDMLINSTGAGKISICSCMSKATHFTETIICKQWQSLPTFFLMKAALSYMMKYSRGKGLY